MKRQREPQWELTIGPDTVRMLILKARAVGAGVNDDYAGGRDREVEFVEAEVRDIHQHDGLAEEEEGDLTAEELRELIDDLNLDEAAELIALMWIGRGDYTADEWPEALAEARQRAERRVSAYLMGMPMLGDWLEEGLEALGA
jgi:hypothetical protein